MGDESLTKLTIFRPLDADQDEEHKSVVVGFFDKLFSRRRDENTDQLSAAATDNEDNSGRQSQVNQSADEGSHKQLPQGSVAAGTTLQPPPERLRVGYSRTLANVTQRISTILNVSPGHTGHLMDYNRSSFRQYWMPDIRGKECYECQEKFTTFRRRHHCRICGQIFCSRCCNQEIPGKLLGYVGGLRLCRYCCKAVLQFLDSTEGQRALLKKGNGTEDLDSLKESLLRNFASPTVSAESTLAASLKKFSRQYDSSSSVNSSTLSLYPDRSFVSSGPVSSITDEFSPYQRRKSSVFGRKQSSSLMPPSATPNLARDIFDLPATGVKNPNNCRLRSDDGANSTSRLNASYCTAAAGVTTFDNGEESDDFDEDYEPEWVKNIKKELPSSEKAILTSRAEVASSPTAEDTTEDNYKKTIPDAVTDAKSRVRSVSICDVICSELDADVSRKASKASIISGGISEQKGLLDLADSQSGASSVSLAVSASVTLPVQISVTSPAAVSVSQSSKASNDVINDSFESTSDAAVRIGINLKSHDTLDALFNARTEQMLRYLLHRASLNEDWFAVLWPIARQIAYTVLPNVKERREDSMDILKYVHVKTLQNNCEPAANIVFGAVCTKSIADARMKANRLNPSILLIDSPIEYERVMGKFCSLDPVISQEHSYLRTVVSKIASFKPQIVIVPFSVARIAQELLRQAKISLVCNLKRSAFERIRRCTEADVVASVDGQIVRPRLGACSSFRTEAVVNSGCQKTLMYFDGCQPDLLCSIVLKGNSKLELAATKKILKYVVKWLYSSKLEIEMLTVHQAGIEKDSQRRKSLSTNLNEENGATSDEVPCNTEGCEICSKMSSMLPASNGAVVLSDDELCAIGPIRLKFMDALLKVPLACSPLLYTTLPFLETNEGKMSSLSNLFKANLFPFNPESVPLTSNAVSGYQYLSDCVDHKTKQKVLFGSAQNLYAGNDEVPFRRSSQRSSTHSGQEELPNSVEIVHPFITSKLTRLASDSSVKRELAKYRAFSARMLRKRIEGAVGDGPKPKKAPRRSSLEPVTVDVLNPYVHQHLAVLYSSYCEKSPNAPGFCTSPWIIFMQYYGERDICLGKYLSDYCFKLDAKCPSENCDVKMPSHIRRFVHGVSCVELIVETIEFVSDAPLGSSDAEEILTWDWCTLCKATTPANAIPRDMWNLSFARYLEYLFRGQYFRSKSLVRECNHCMFHEFSHYFSLRNVVACFKISLASVLDICLPAKSCPALTCFDSAACALVDEAKVLTEIASRVFSAMLEQLTRIKSLPEFSVGGGMGGKLAQAVADLSELYDFNQTSFLTYSESCRERASNWNLSYHQDDLDTFLNIQASFVRCQHFVASAVQKWNSYVTEFILMSKKHKDKILDDKAPSSRDCVQAATPPAAEPIPSGVPSAAGCSRESLKPFNKTELQQQCDYNAYTDRTSTPASTPPALTATASVASMFAMADTSLDLSASSVSVVDSSASTVPLRRTTESCSTIASSSSRTISFNASFILNQVPLPFELYEHHGLPASEQHPVAVNELRISSMIAYALTMKEYDVKLKAVREFFFQQGLGISLKYSAFAPPTSEVEQNPQVAKSNNDTMSSMLSSADWSKQSGQHIEVQFSDQSTKFYCKIYFAEHFRMLRKLICPEGEHGYVLSLSNCHGWQPRGGKSGMAFFKTSDDRFVVKQMSGFEMQSFFKFAANYFNFVATYCSDNKLSTLAKIFGVYRIVFRNQTTGLASKMDVLVMENLFCNRNVSQIFDLKGSARNRLVAESDRPMVSSEDLVLLDENLLKMSCRNPIYVHSHAKTVLKVAIARDTEFLSNNLIMDYSLLVGIDEERRELIVGIIDYVRTYTWDKRLETFVKSVSVSGPLPTVVSPEIYKHRFREAMESYFLVSPDKWKWSYDTDLACL